MAIPIQNIYYMLCYAWDQLEERDLVQVESLPTNNLADLFANVLANGLAVLRKRGMDRGYIARSEDTHTPRGKIKINESVKRCLLINCKAHCEFDILSYNILHNRIIKSTIISLLKLKDLDATVIRPRLQDILRWFPDVDEIPLNGGVFSQVQLHRNNSFYRLLINVCALIFENLLVSEDTGDTYFRDFTKSARQMRVLFEKFVRNFYFREQDEFDVGSPRIAWHGRPLDQISSAYLPVMQTDITLSSQTRMIIIDTKFYSRTLSMRFEKERIHSPNLYQIFSYVKNAEQLGDLGGNCEGILLYPTVDRDLSLTYHLAGHHISVRTINLNRDWKWIRQDLLSLIERDDLAAWR